MFGLSPYVLIGFAVALVAAGATGAAGMYHWDQVAYLKLEKKQEDADLKQAKDVLQGYEANVTTINNAAREFLAGQNDFGVKLDEIGKDLHNVQTQKPLPVNCKPDAGRVRDLNAAIEATNTRIGR